MPLPPSRPRPSLFQGMLPAKPGAPGSKLAKATTDRTVAGSPAPSAAPGAAANKSQTFTYLTKAPTVGLQGSPILYNGDRLWVKVTLTLETAGPVAVGFDSNLEPVLSGRGVLLQTNIPREFLVGKSSRLYITATGVNRVAVSIEPLPWLEQITATIESVVAALKDAFTRK